MPKEIEMKLLHKKLDQLLLKDMKKVQSKEEARGMLLDNQVSHASIHVLIAASNKYKSIVPIGSVDT